MDFTKKFDIHVFSADAYAQKLRKEFSDMLYETAKRELARHDRSQFEREFAQIQMAVSLITSGSVIFGTMMNLSQEKLATMIDGYVNEWKNLADQLAREHEAKKGKKP